VKLQTSRRRVLRLAERHRGLPHDRRGRFGGIPQALLNEAGVAVLADIHFGARVPGEGQHVRFSYAASKEAIQQGVRAHGRFHPQEHPKGGLT
jgi:hypothetical protein